MPYEPSRGVYRFIDEELDVPHQTGGHRPKQQLPRRDIAAAERQAMIEARARQRNFQGTIGMTPEALPSVRPRPDAEDDELYEDEDLSTRPPRSAVRYVPEEIYREGHTRLYAGQVVIPKKRRSAQQQLPPAQTQQYPFYVEDEEREPASKPKHSRRGVRLHWLAIFGIGMLCMLACWMIGSNVVSWWQIHQDDSTYGSPRTFQIDAVVGHNDSATSPSHFEAINLNRHVIVIELPGGDPNKARIYPITTLFGDGQDLTPVTLSFKDVTGNGLLDMEIHIENQTLVMMNENGTFRPLKAGERVHV